MIMINSMIIIYLILNVRMKMMILMMIMMRRIMMMLRRTMMTMIMKMTTRSMKVVIIFINPFCASFVCLFSQIPPSNIFSESSSGILSAHLSLDHFSFDNFSEKKIETRRYYLIISVSAYILLFLNFSTVLIIRILLCSPFAEFFFFFFNF